MNIGLWLGMLGVMGAYPTDGLLPRSRKARLAPDDAELEALRAKAQAKRDRRNAKQLRNAK